MPLHYVDPAERMAKSLAALRSSMRVEIAKVEPEPAPEPARAHVRAPEPAPARAHEAEIPEADLELIEAGVEPEQVKWLNSQLSMGGYAAEVARDLIAKATAKTKTPQYSLPDKMRARKHRFHPTEG